MKLGANFTLIVTGPDDWAAQVLRMGGTAAVAPITCAAGSAKRAAYAKAARQNGITLAEVGVWNNTLNPDDAARKEAVEYAKGQLALSEELGAACCVNTAGVRGPVWDGCYAENLTADTWAMVVDTVREIIDAVRPKRTFYTLEPVGWMVPSTPEDYLRLLRDINRPAFAVHMDYTNFITGIGPYMNQRDFFEQAFRLLAPHIKSIHAKDILLQPGTPLSIKEVPPGHGSVDFAHVMRLANRVHPDIPFLVEHLQTGAECTAAIAHVKAVAQQNGIDVRGLHPS